MHFLKNKIHQLRGGKNMTITKHQNGTNLEIALEGRLDTWNYYRK